MAEKLPSVEEAVGIIPHRATVACTGLGGAGSPPAHEGLFKRVIGGHYGLTPRLAQLCADGRFEAYNWPSGVISRLYPAIAAEQPGLLTSIGRRTFVDPIIFSRHPMGLSARF